MDTLECELIEIVSEIANVDKEIVSLHDRRRELVERKRYLEQEKKARSTKENEGKSLDLDVWSSESFQWSKDLSITAKDIFKIKSFRELQLPCLNATLSKKDCILIIPTGGGKSLCYQLSALVSTGWTLVISPLISLMEDQVISMRNLDIDCRLLSASTGKDVQKSIMDDMTNTKSALKLLYVTPERLAKSKRFMTKLQKAHQLGLLARIAIDEVHCCSQWGHDFRPDYKFLGILKTQFPGTPLLCLTATASTDVIEDVKNVLNLPPSTILFRSHFNRPNLYYEVVEKPSQAAQCYEVMADLIRTNFPKQSGIVYCLSRKDAEELSYELQKRGIRTGFYHADIGSTQRSDIHQKWINNKIQVVVATIAFGLGIDKPDVRFVIHHSLSKSLENYYQESGRCGRDGKMAKCILFYRLADVFRISCMVFHERNTLPKLYGILRYAQSVEICRRKSMAQIFGEKAPECNKGCDVCLKPLSLTKLDCSQIAAEILQALFPTGQNNSSRLTFLKTLDKLTKLKSVKSLKLTQGDLERMISYMLLNGIIKEDFHFTPYSTISYLVPSSIGARQLEKGTLSVQVNVVERHEPSKNNSSSGKRPSSTNTQRPSVAVKWPKDEKAVSGPTNDDTISIDSGDDLIFQ